MPLKDGKRLRQLGKEKVFEAFPGSRDVMPSNLPKATLKTFAQGSW